MKFCTQTRKPRNPLVAAMQFRRGGAHRGGHSRQLAQRALRAELDRTRHDSP